MTLHIVNRSPYRSSALRDCLAVMTEGDALLLIEDGVYAAAASGQAGTLPAETYCLGADADARGVSVSDAIARIDDARWVALCVEHTPVVSWF